MREHSSITEQCPDNESLELKCARPFLKSSKVKLLVTTTSEWDTTYNNVITNLIKIKLSQSMMDPWPGTRLVDYLGTVP